MSAGLPKLSSIYLDPCKRLQRELRMGGRYYDLYRAARAASPKQSKRLETLLVGLMSCEEWRRSSTRRINLSGSQFAAEWRRGTKLFDRFARRREGYRERDSLFVESLIMLGYALSFKTTTVKRAHWYPIADAVDAITRSPDWREPDGYDAQAAVLNRVRERFRRLKLANDGELPVELARSFFKQVHATLSTQNSRASTPE